MARPSSAPLFTRDDPYAIAVEDPRPLVDPITGKSGMNQFLVAPERDDYRPVNSQSNRVQDGQMPRSTSKPLGDPDAANPLGRGWADSLE